ncbi:sugar phosphate isomerase/epimerase family protein [Mesorhizobium sp. SB112]|uniref:sugar phosphate isomerase/epimerase family protein n=1 Tax=Mesorhizobium sp. SB112 TaxID=3151853 RepID=UPI00326627C8
MFRTSFHSGFLTDCTATEAVRMIRDHGYDAAELNAETLPWARGHIGPDTSANTRAELARLGPFSAISAHNSDFGLTDVSRREAAVDWTLKLIEQAPDYGVDIVHVIPGNDADLESLYASLSAAAEAAEKIRVTLALEPIVGQRIGTTDGALAAIQRVPGLKINFDPSHLQVMEHDIPNAISRLGAHACHVHIKDATGHPDEWAFVKLGTGDIDFVGMFGTLAAKDFDGHVSVEHESHWFSDDDRPVSQVLSESLAFIHDAVKRAGVR